MQDDRDSVDWSVTTWEGNRRRQRQEFRALSFREKLLRLEQMDDLARAMQRARPGLVRESPDPK